MNTDYSIDRRARSRPAAAVPAWFAEAEAAGVAVPETMALATATPDGRPSVRMVLLKGADERGFAFYTNTRAARARSWPRTRAPRSSSTGSRSAGRCASRARRGASARGVGGVLRDAPGRQPARRLGLAAEPAARDRAELERLYDGGSRALPADDVPLPPHWGGYRLVPGRDRALGAPRRPPARPRALHRAPGDGACGWRRERAVGRASSTGAVPSLRARAVTAGGAQRARRVDAERVPEQVAARRRSAAPPRSARRTSASAYVRPRRSPAARG